MNGPVPSDEELRGLLVERLETSDIDLRIDAIADALLPVVRRWADQRAAEVINGFAAGTEGLDPWIARKMRDRADALTREATP